MVRFDVPVREWPAGAEGTVVEAFEDDAIIEVDHETVLAPYSAMTIIWSAHREHAL